MSGCSVLSSISARTQFAKSGKFNTVMGEHIPATSHNTVEFGFEGLVPESEAKATPTTQNVIM